MDTDAEEVRVLTGFSFEWEHRPHRVKVVGVDVADPAPDIEVRGGSWADGARATDTAVVDVGMASLDRPCQRGTTRMTLHGEGRAPAVGDSTFLVPEDARAAAAFLTGFRFEIGPEHRYGYTLHAMSVQIGEPVVQGGYARVPVHVELDGGLVPDRFQRLRRGAWDASVSVSWVVLGADEDQIQRASASGSVRRWPAFRGEKANGTVRVMAPIRAPERALVGLSGFRIDLKDGPLDGRYTREMRVWTEVPAADAVPVSLGFDNAGMLARPIHVDLGADLTALELYPGEHAVRESFTEPTE